MVNVSDDDLVAFVNKHAAEGGLDGKTAIVFVTEGKLDLYAAVPADKINETLDTYCKRPGMPPVYMLDIKNSKTTGIIAEFDWGKVEGEEE